MPEAERQKAVQGVQKVLFVCKATGCCAGQYRIYYIVSTEFVKLAQSSFLFFLISPILVLFLPCAFKGEEAALDQRHLKIS